MWRSIAFACVLFVSVFADDLVIKNYNSKISFHSKGSLDSSNVADFFLRILGMTVPSDVVIKNVETKSPFYYAKALVVVEDHTHSKWINDLTSATYKIKESVNWEDVKDSIKLSLHKRFGQKVLTADSPRNERGELLGTAKHLNASYIQDKSVLLQLSDLNVFTDEIIERDSVPTKTVLWVTDESLSELMATNGRSSDKFEEASDLFSTAVENIVQVLKDTYNDKVVSVIISKEDAVLKRRSLLQVVNDNAGPSNSSNTTIPGTTVGSTSSDFAIVFNIVLWLSILLVLALLAISVSISQMDPGRDSIIYRMTSQRIKKEQ